jgi:hypothetical protein
LTWWNFPKKAWLIIIGLLAVISCLSVSLYVTYLSNFYFQAYVNSISPILVPILSVSFGISSASIATYLYLGMKRIRSLQDPGITVKTRNESRKTPKRVQHSSTPRLKTIELAQTTPLKLKPIAPLQSHEQSQKPPSKERENHGPNPEKRTQP